eukprot:2984653-Pleurochrysis_carterae.AAC.1
MRIEAWTCEGRCGLEENDDDMSDEVQKQQSMVICKTERMRLVKERVCVSTFCPRPGGDALRPWRSAVESFVNVDGGTEGRKARSQARKEEALKDFPGYCPWRMTMWRMTMW